MGYAYFKAVQMVVLSFQELNTQKELLRVVFESASLQICQLTEDLSKLKYEVLSRLLS